MLCSCIVTKLKNTFDSLVCEFTAKAGEGGIVSRCRCNIFTVGKRTAGSALCFCPSSIRKSLSHLKSVNVVYVTCSRLKYFYCCKLTKRLMGMAA